MKRSTHVTAPLLASAALALLAGCRQQMKRCVDDHNVVVDDSLCAAQQNQQNRQGTTNRGVYPGYWPYHFYYGGYGGFGRGSVVGGGSFTPKAGVSYSTSRGGFGSSHGSDGGGHGGAGE